MTEPVCGILFDLDGTVFDTPASMLVAARLALAGLVPADQARAGAAIWLADASARYTAYLAGTLSFAEQRAARVGDLFGVLGLPEPDRESVARWLAAYRAAQLRHAIVFADVQDCLRSCDGYAIGAVSNNDGQWQRARLAAAGLDTSIGPVIGIDDAGVAKPDPRIFHAGCAALGLTPDQVAYVGDDLALDAQAATAAGLHGIWLDRTGSDPTGGDVPRITTLRQLASSVARFGQRPGVR